MAITVKKLVKNVAKRYKMELVAGEKGVDNLVQWAHIVEDMDVTLFLRGQEIVFTVGIMNKYEGWLLKFTKNLYEVGVSAFVVNLGPHTKEIPKEVIDFCNEVNMPLFIIPWETRLVDVTRDFCHKIMLNDNIEASIVTTIKNIIFKVGDLETQILQFERYGYRRDSKILFMCIALDEKYGTEEYEIRMTELRKNAEWIARGIRDLFISFEYKEKLILTLAEYEENEIDRFTEELTGVIKAKKLYSKVNIGVSANIPGMVSQDKNFRNAFLTCELAQKRHEYILKYDQLDMYKFIMAVSDREILREYYDKTVGKLEMYDMENDTNLVEFLRVYLENNASPQVVSDKLFIHRNTVNNQLRKIEKIVGIDLSDLEGKMKYYIAFYVADILQDVHLHK